MVSKVNKAEVKAQAYWRLMQNHYHTAVDRPNAYRVLKEIAEELYDKIIPSNQVNEPKSAS